MVNIDAAAVAIPRELLVFILALLKYTVGFPFISTLVLNVTVPDPTTALAAFPRPPRLVQPVRVHPLVLQLVRLLFAWSQKLSPAIPPASTFGAPHTTEFVANAVLFVTFESQGFVIRTLKVTLVPLAARVGVTGIRRVSVPVGADMVVVLVQVTPVPICAPHDHPLSRNAELGPVIFVGTVNMTVWTPLELAFPIFETVIGSCESVPTASGHSG